MRKAGRRLHSDVLLFTQSLFLFLFFQNSGAGYTGSEAGVWRRRRGSVSFSSAPTRDFLESLQPPPPERRSGPIRITLPGRVPSIGAHQPRPRAARIATATRPRA